MPGLDVELIWAESAGFHYLATEVLNPLLLDEPATEVSSKLYDFLLLGKRLLTETCSSLYHRLLLDTSRNPILSKVGGIRFETWRLDIGKKEMKKCVYHYWVLESVNPILAPYLKHGSSFEQIRHVPVCRCVELLIGVVG